MGCSVAGCDRPAKWRGLCRNHYIADQYRDTPRPSNDELWARVAPRIVAAENGCWIWTGAINRARRGYGVFGFNAEGKNTTLWVHRFVYEHLVGPIADGLTIDHLCYVPACCNPAHLEPVPSSENVKRMLARNGHPNSRKTHCVNGHPFDEANTNRTPRGRSCKACREARSRK